MKNLILLFALALVFSFSSIAQEAVQDDHDYVYCQIVGQGKLFSKKVTVTIDAGDEESSNIWKRNFLKDAQGNPIVFNTMIGALNYMASKEWDFVQAYTLTIGNQNVYHYLMKKKVSDLGEEEEKTFIKQ